MSPGFFITATGTSVGKTLISACLTRALLDSGRRAAYFKPVETGCSPDSGETATIGIFAEGAAVYSGDTYRLPASPHLAAREEGRPVSCGDHIRKAHELARTYDGLIIEGAGGLGVPLDENGYTMASLAADMSFPVIIVADSGLGTINHTLMTVHYARSCSLNIAGLVFNRYEDTLMHRSNVQTILKLTGLPVIATVPEIDTLTPESVKAIAVRFKEFLREND